MIYQIISAYFEDDCADELTIDPVFNAILEKNSLASQPTLSRFFNRMDADTRRRMTANVAIPLLLGGDTYDEVKILHLLWT